MNINLIVAIGQNNEIGHNNQLLIHLPKDLKYFKTQTWGLPIIMGKRTFESLNKKPLQGRTNIVLTNSISQSDTDLISQHYPLLKFASNTNDALNIAATLHTKMVFVIGGEKTYATFLPIASTLFITKIKQAFQHADAFFPSLNPSQWKKVSSTPHFKDDKNPVDFDFEVWQKIKN